MNKIASKIYEEPGIGPSYSIKEASRVSQVPIHVLRYWEDQKLLRPARTAHGHRRYRQMDIGRVLKIREYFYVKGMQLRGVRKALMEESRKKKISQELPLELATQSAASALLDDTKMVLKEILQILR